MSRRKNRESRRLFFWCGIITVFVMVLMLVVKAVENRYYGNLVNEKIAALLGNVREQYPDLAEEQLIALLNQRGGSEAGRQILKQYGIGTDTYAIMDMEQWNNQQMVINTAVLAVLAFLLLGMFSWYQRRRQRSLDALTHYVQAVSKGNYQLDLTDNTEDELSNLKNELYKITVMLKEQARQSQAQKVALADSVSDISHQLKTPLTSISVLLDNLSENEDMNPYTRVRFLGEITRQVQQMNWLVVSLLKLSRLDAGVVSFEEQQIPLDRLLQEIAVNLEIITELKSVTIEVKGAPGISIRGDYSWNREAIQNIIKNAVEHTAEGSSVLVKVEDNSVYSKISVQDFGEGISPEDIRHIFERFYQAKNSAEQSIGIGLSLAKSIIEKQNGYLSVSSEEGVGTTFVIKYLK